MEQKRTIVIISLSLGLLLMFWSTLSDTWNEYESNRKMKELLSHVPRNGGFGVFPKDPQKTTTPQPSSIPTPQPVISHQPLSQSAPELVETKETYTSLLQGRFAETKRVPTSKEPPSPKHGTVWHTDVGDFVLRDTGVWLIIGGETWNKYDPNQTRAWNLTNPLMGCKYGAYLPTGTLETQSDVIGCR